MADFRTITASVSIATVLAFAQPAHAQYGPYDPIVPGVAEFGDWSIACDNAGDCTAVSISRALAREREQAGIGALPNAKIWISRSAGPDAPVRVVLDARVWGEEPTNIISPDQPDADLPVGLRAYTECEGECLDAVYPLVRISPGQYQLQPHLSRIFLQESLRAEMIASQQIYGGLHTLISIDGLRDVLRRMDVMQHRSGTVTAIIEQGPAGADTVLPAGPRDHVAVVRGAELADVAIDRNDALQRAYTLYCDGTDHDLTLPAQHFQLDDGHELWGVMCGSSPFHSERMWLISGEDGTPYLAPLPRPDQNDGEMQPFLSNSHYDPDQGLLISYSGGLCGWQMRWAWTGKGFAMADSLWMPTCLDVLPQDWLQTYRAILH